MPPFSRPAAQAIKTFRMRELEGLMSHLRLHGPLPTPSEATSAASTAGVVGTKTPSVILPNPFIPTKNPKTGKWRAPKYSLRRQADLVKQAKASGNLTTMPPGPKTFAMELRRKRVEASWPTSYNSSGPRSSTSPEENAPAVPDNNTAVKKHSSEANYEKHVAALNEQINIAEESVQKLEAELALLAPQHDLDQLAAFERKSGEAEGDRAARVKREADHLLLEEKITAANQEVVDKKYVLAVAKEEEEAREKLRAMALLWKNPLWVGEFKPKTTKGAELGTRLYTGKKKMFKGHLWERQKAKRVRRQSILMRDMAARVARYKSYYKKRKPNPLKPSRLTKPPKLPF